jgi:hypothetical protein
MGYVEGRGFACLPVPIGFDPLTRFSRALIFSTNIALVTDAEPQDMLGNRLL